jgi:hypothetical protein
VLLYKSTAIRPEVLYILHKVYTGFIQQKLSLSDSPVAHFFCLYSADSAEIWFWGFTLLVIRNILGAFAKLQKPTCSFVMPVYSSLCPHAAAQLLLARMPVWLKWG